MSEEQITPKRRGRPPKNKMAQVMKEIDKAGLYDKGLPRETPTIKEGAHWQVGVPEEEQDELKRRHNEAMQNAKDLAYDPARNAIVLTQEPELTADSAIQIKEGPNRGVICQVGQVQGDLVMCYQQLPNGEKTYLSTKMGEFIVLCPRRAGMVARKWEQKEAAPTWHETKVHVPEGN